MKIEFNPKGVCSRHYTIEIEDGIIKDIKIEGGCAGNLKGISNILIGMDVDHVIERFDGVDCNGKGTSCPDQIAQALKIYRQSI